MSSSQEEMDPEAAISLTQLTKFAIFHRGCFSNIFK